MAPAAIRTLGLTKHFGRVVALDDLNLEVSPGEIFGFLGPNGAGKSTTIRLLLGLIRPTAGQAWLAGVPVSDVEQAHRSVSYVPGDVSLWPQLTGTESLVRVARVQSGDVGGGHRGQELAGPSGGGKGGDLGSDGLDFRGPVQPEDPAQRGRVDPGGAFGAWLSGQRPQHALEQHRVQPVEPIA